MEVTRRQAKRVGDGYDVDWSRFSLNEFTMGMNVELEHRSITGGNLNLTGRIVLDHLEEVPDYYTRLKEVERESG